MDTATVTVPLNKLKASPKNVRKTGLGARIEELAVSIAALGLLQPPVVEPEQDADGNETGYYLVEAGERRRRALCLLAKQKRIKKTEPITCTLKKRRKRHRSVACRKLPPGTNASGRSVRSVPAPCRGRGDGH